LCYNSGGSPPLLTAQVWVQSQSGLCGIFCECTETGSSATALVSAASFCFMNFHISSYIIRDWYNRPQYQGTQSCLMHTTSYSDHLSNTAVGSSDYAMLGSTVLQKSCGSKIVLCNFSNNCPKRCNVIQFIYICKLLYMFRVVPPPIIRSTHKCIYSIWYLSNWYCYLPLSWTPLHSNSSTIATGSSNGLTSTRCCRYSCVCS